MNKTKTFLLGALCLAGCSRTALITFEKALSLDGTTTYVTNVFSAGDLTLPYTVEFFYRPSSVSGSPVLVEVSAGGQNAQISLASEKIQASFPTGTCSGLGGFSGSSALVASINYHIAVVVADNNSGASGLPGVSIYLNGILDGSSTTSVGTCTGLTGVTVGGDSSGANLSAGIIDELRISKVARYTGAFTAPTSPFATDDDTVLLNHWNTDAATVDYSDSTHTAGTSVGTLPSLVTSPF